LPAGWGRGAFGRASPPGVPAAVFWFFFFRRQPSGRAGSTPAGWATSRLPARPSNKAVLFRGFTPSDPDPFRRTAVPERAPAAANSSAGGGGPRVSRPALCTSFHRRKRGTPALPPRSRAEHRGGPRSPAGQPPCDTRPSRASSPGLPSASRGDDFPGC